MRTGPCHRRIEILHRTVPGYLIKFDFVRRYFGNLYPNLAVVIMPLFTKVLGFIECRRLRSGSVISFYFREVVEIIATATELCTVRKFLTSV